MRDVGLLDEAARVLEERLAFIKQHQGVDGRKTDAFATWNSLAGVRDAERFPEAETALRELIDARNEYRRELDGGQWKNIYTDVNSTSALRLCSNLGRVVLAQGKLEEAESLLNTAGDRETWLQSNDATERTEEENQKSLKRLWLDIVASCAGLADLRLQQGQLGPAQQIVDVALADAMRELGPNHQHTLHASAVHALIGCAQRGTDAAGDAAVSDVLDRMREFLGEEHQQRGRSPRSRRPRPHVFPIGVPRWS